MWSRCWLSGYRKHLKTSHNDLQDNFRTQQNEEFDQGGDSDGSKSSCSEVMQKMILTLMKGQLS